MTLKLFKAEDIPRMDSNKLEKMKNFFVGGTKKEHVDPYFTFSFAGKEVGQKQEPYIFLFVVACTRHYKPLCRSVGPSVADCTIV